MSAILDNWLAGEGVPDVLVIDGHIHVGNWKHNATFRDVDEAVGTAERKCDAHGVDAFCAMSGGYMLGGVDYRRGNDFLLEMWERMPERLIPFLCVDPNDSRSGVLAELERMFQAGVRGIKLINAYQGDYPGDGPNLMALYEFAADRGMIVLNHSWTREVFEKIAALHPTVDFIFGHCQRGEFLQNFDNGHSNIWAYPAMGAFDRAFEINGARKYMLGSDGFLNSLALGIGPVVFSPLDDEDKKLVLGLNMARILDRAGTLPDCLKKKYVLV